MVTGSWPPGMTRSASSPHPNSGFSRLEVVAVSQASADMMADLVTGETVEEARRLCGLFMKMVKGETLTDEEKEDLDEAAQLESISHMPARVKCAELGWRTLSEIIGE